MAYASKLIYNIEKVIIIIILLDPIRSFEIILKRIREYTNLHTFVTPVDILMTIIISYIEVNMIMCYDYASYVYYYHLHLIVVHTKYRKMQE